MIGRPAPDCRQQNRAKLNSIWRPMAVRTTRPGAVTINDDVSGRALGKLVASTTCYFALAKG
jgi:hypothetical protein